MACKINNKSFFNQEMMCYEMSNLSSFDIDYPYQFEIAEIILLSDIAKDSQTSESS